MEAVVALSRNMVMGKAGRLPWHIPEDLQRFRSLTQGHILIMGRKTFESLPGVLPEREHWVITSTPGRCSPQPHVRFFALHEIQKALAEAPATQKKFVIGGASILSHFLASIHRVHLTLVDKVVEGDVTWHLPTHFGLTCPGTTLYSEQEKCQVHFLEYEPNMHSVCDEQGYLDLVKDIMEQGTMRPDRTGTGTRSVFGRQLRFHLSRGIPLLTTKAMAWKSCVKELLWFLRGDTNAKHLEEEGVKIWQGNTTRAFLDSRGLVDLPEGDIGAGYGFQWRHFGATYGTCLQTYLGMGVDQMARVLDSLRNDPFGRRHIVSAWNPAALDKMALPPCHILFQFYVDEDEEGQKHLSCHMYQRSVDCFLGLPFNIFSYAVLTHIVAAKVGMIPKELILSTGDTHIYLDHVEQVTQQIQRAPCPLPCLVLSPTVAAKDFTELTIDDFELRGYMHHPALKGKMSI